MQIQKQKKKRSTIRMYIPNQSAIINILHDIINTNKRK